MIIQWDQTSLEWLSRSSVGWIIHSIVVLLVYKLFNMYLCSGQVFEPRIMHEKEKEDQIGHFLLKLAYSRSPDLIKWFIDQEITLFRYFH